MTNSFLIGQLFHLPLYLFTDFKHDCRLGNKVCVDSSIHQLISHNNLVVFGLRTLELGLKPHNLYCHWTFKDVTHSFLFSWIVYGVTFQNMSFYCLLLAVSLLNGCCRRLIFLTVALLTICFVCSFKDNLFS